MGGVVSNGRLIAKQSHLWRRVMKRLLFVAVLFGACACTSSSNLSPLTPTPLAPTPPHSTSTLTVSLRFIPARVVHDQVTTFVVSTTAPSGTALAITDITLNFGDGVQIDLGALTGGSDMIGSHINTAAGDFTIQLSATDSNGNKTSTAFRSSRFVRGLSVVRGRPTHSERRHSDG